MASKAMLAVLLVAAFLSSVAEGKRATVHAVEESRAGAVFDSFCFSEGGTLSIRVSNVKLGAAGEGEKQKRIGLIAQSNNEGAAISMDEFALGQCIADSPWVKEGKFLDIPITSEGSTTEKVINANEVGRVLLIYYNCETDVTPSFTLELEMKSESGSFLPAGETPLPWIYLSFAIVYLAAGIAWIVYTKKNASTVKKIHWLMTAVIVLKLLSLAFEAVKFASDDAIGILSGWSVIYYVFTFLKGVLMFTVVVLIGAGWSFVKPFVTDKEKKVILVVIPLQVIINIAAIVIDENVPALQGWLTWRDILHLLDIVCCCAILFPIVWSIKHLREAAGSDGKAAKMLQKLVLFRQFYLLVVAYVYFTRIIVYLVGATLPCHLEWFSILLTELATAAFYIWTGVKFRPMPANPYFHVDDDEGLPEGEERVEEDDQL